MFHTKHKILKVAKPRDERLMRRSDICVYFGPAERAELEDLRTDCNMPHKLAWRLDIVLSTAVGVGTVEIMKRT